MNDSLFGTVVYTGVLDSPYARGELAKMSRDVVFCASDGSAEGSARRIEGEGRVEGHVARM